MTNDEDDIESFDTSPIIAGAIGAVAAVLLVIGMLYAIWRTAQ